MQVKPAKKIQENQEGQEMRELHGVESKLKLGRNFMMQSLSETKCATGC